VPAAEGTAASGIVRRARRPAGWVACGPRPTLWDRPALAPRAGEDLCWLAGDWRILQRVDGHRWSLDDLVTAHFAARACGDVPPRRFLDLGCGIGSVLMLVAWRFPDAHGVGVEAQEVSVELARRSLAGNGADARCSVRLGDLRDPSTMPEGTRFDLVTGTPPYLPPGSARASQRVQCAPCRMEERGGIEDYCLAAARALAPGGCFVACAGGTQRARVEAAARAAGLCLTSSRDVVPREGKAPLLAVHVLRSAEEVARRCLVAPEEPPLVVRAADGRWTDEFRALRRDMGMP
jgi:tRNA1(Val) A37 N6-methylase TrmN6